jgi:hypothetical protein
MGLDYSINLCFPSDRLGPALALLASMATEVIRFPDGQQSPQGGTTVRLPSGNSVALPFTSAWASGTVDLPFGGEARFETGLLFPLDDAIRESCIHQVEVIGGEEFAQVGYIYLTIRLGCLYAELSFLAATSGMSRLFVNSASIRGRFRELLDEGGGVAAWLDMEAGEFHSLAEPSRTFWPQGGSDDNFVKRQWRTPDVIALARAVGDGHLDSLPALADALQEAGCDDARILDHCRLGGSHAGGCQVAAGSLSQMGARGWPTRRL